MSVHSSSPLSARAMSVHSSSPPSARAASAKKGVTKRRAPKFQEGQDIVDARRNRIDEPFKSTAKVARREKKKKNVPFRSNAMEEDVFESDWTTSASDNSFDDPTYQPYARRRGHR